MAGVTTDHGDQQRLSLMVFMRGFRKENGYMPSIKQIAEALGMQRTSVVWHLEMLREEGRIDYADGNMSRSLRVVR